MGERKPYKPDGMAEWSECWQTTCAACARMPGCDICEAMIEHLAGEGTPWPEGGFVTDPGAGMSCLSYQPHRKAPRLSRQQVRRLSRDQASPVCGGCAATKGTDASRSLHTRRDFDASVKERREFVCHETGGYCGGWVRAVLARARKRTDA